MTSLRDWARRAALGWWDATRLATGVGLVLCLCLFVFRLYQLASFWPTPGTDLWQELPQALWMGLRFDLKAVAVAAFVLWPWLCLPRRVREGVVALWVLAFGLLGMIPERRHPVAALYGGLTLRNGVPIGYVQADIVVLRNAFRPESCAAPLVPAA